jgi:hypothetical protein
MYCILSAAHLCMMPLCVHYASTCTLRQRVHVFLSLFHWEWSFIH